MPEDAAKLVEAAFRVSVEVFAPRAFPASEYARAGCEIVPAGFWRKARLDAFILGLKEPPEAPVALAHRHLFFADGQGGATALVERFLRDGGVLLDLASLTDGDGPALVHIDHLATALPRESSLDFSAQLLPHLFGLAEGSDVWRRAERIFLRRQDPGPRATGWTVA